MSERAQRQLLMLSAQFPLARSSRIVAPMERCSASEIDPVTNYLPRRSCDTRGAALLSIDEEAEFWLFYRKTSEVLFRKAYRMCRGNKADADDAHQRAYLKFLEHWPQVSGLSDRQRVAWLATTLTREVLQIWREPHRYREAEPHDESGHHPSVSADHADAVYAADRYHKVCRAIALMEGRPREVIAMHCLAGYEISEVAEMLEIDQGTVRVHLHSGRERLRTILAREEDLPDGQA